MPRRRRRSPLEDLFEVMSGFTDLFWQVGLIITLMFLAGGFHLLTEAINYQPSVLLAQLEKQFGWIRYVIPVMFFLFSFIFGTKTYSAYKKQNFHFF